MSLNTSVSLSFQNFEIWAIIVSSTMMTSLDYMSMYRNQNILHIINCKYTFNFYLKEVIRNLKYLRENDVNLI